MSKRTARIRLRMVKDSDAWNELCTELGLLPKRAEAYFEYGEYASLELEVDEDLNIVGGRILRRDGLDEQPPPKRRKPHDSKTCVHCARVGPGVCARERAAIGEVDAVLDAAKECTRCQLKLSSMSTATDCNMLDHLCPIWGTHGHLWDGNEERSRAAYAASIAAAKEQEDRRRRCLAGLQACARAGTQTPAMFALNRHVLGTHAAKGVGFETAADALLAAGFDPPEDPQWFSAAMACNLLGVSA